MRTLEQLGISPAPWGTVCGCFAENCKPLKLADARLIAAAPKLYEALQFINEHIAFTAPGGGADVVADAKRMMIDALASASGESEEASR